MQNRRELFERFAHTKGGNPLDPHFWYSMNYSKLREFKVPPSSSLLSDNDKEK